MTISITKFRKLLKSDYPFLEIVQIESGYRPDYSAPGTTFDSSFRKEGLERGYDGEWYSGNIKVEFSYDILLKNGEKTIWYNFDPRISNFIEAFAAFIEDEIDN